MTSLLTVEALRRWPLPALSGDADKEERGRILVVAGSREIPGAALLAACAALRAGAGKLVVATAASAAMPLALAMPEARVIGLPETPAGGLAPDAAPLLASCLAATDAVVIGPGLMDRQAGVALVAQLLAQPGACPVVLDALAMEVVKTPGLRPVLVTPHAGEMAQLTGLSRAQVLANPTQVAAAAAREWNAVVALKGAVTTIATPDGRLWQHRSHQPGLGMSGSGDVLAGIIGGLAARGASLEQACAWGVALHAQAGEQLARSMGPLGYLARELAGQVPAALCALQG